MVAGGIVLGVPAAAQEATPAGDGLEIPQPDECVVEPRPVAFFEQYLEGTSDDAATPEPARTPVGTEGSEPADPETVAAVSATARQVLACLNAGDSRRAAALFTDGYFDRLFGQFGRLPHEEFRRFAATPVPAPAASWTHLLEIREVVLLVDGRVSATIVTDDPAAPPVGPQTAVLIFAEQDGRWLVDEPIRTLAPTATPAATPAG
jgi:hypothetical protein